MLLCRCDILLILHYCRYDLKRQFLLQDGAAETPPAKKPKTRTVISAAPKRKQATAISPKQIPLVKSIKKAPTKAIKKTPMQLCRSSHRHLCCCRGGAIGNALDSHSKDLDVIRNLVENYGFDPDGQDDGYGMDTPMFLCVNVSDGKGLGLARYLHSKGAKGYDVSAAVETGDLDRFRELAALEKIDFTTDANGGVQKKARGWLLRCKYSGNLELARYIWDRLGKEEDAYPLELAISLEDEARIAKLQKEDTYDVKQAFLVDRIGIYGYKVPLPAGGKEGWAEAEKVFCVKYHKTADRIGSYLRLESPLATAVMTGNVGTIASICKSGGDVEQAFDYAGERTPLWHALGVRSPEVVQCLLDHGAQPAWLTKSASASAPPASPDVTLPAKCMRQVMSRQWGMRDGEMGALEMAKYLCNKHPEHFNASMLAVGGGLDNMKHMRWNTMAAWVRANQ